MSTGLPQVHLQSKKRRAFLNPKGGASFGERSCKQSHGKERKVKGGRENIMTNTRSRKNLRKLRLIGIWGMLMLCFISELFVYTWSRVQCVGIGYEISKATRREKELAALYNNLKVELASLKTPSRIADIAKNRLGLTAPTPEQTIVIP